MSDNYGDRWTYVPRGEHHWYKRVLLCDRQQCSECLELFLLEVRRGSTYTLSPGGRLRYRWIWQIRRAGEPYNGMMTKVITWGDEATERQARRAAERWWTKNRHTVVL
jgi:hypothetical protein